MDDFGVISAKRTFKGYREEHRKINMNELISQSERKTISGRFTIDWTKSFEGIKIPHRKQDCLDCKNELMYGEDSVKRNRNCFNCEMRKV